MIVWSSLFYIMATGYADWRAAVCCGERSGRMDLGMETSVFLAYTAGMLLLYFCGRLLFVPLKFMLKLLICSAGFRELLRYYFIFNWCSVLEYSLLLPK